MELRFASLNAIAAGMGKSRYAAKLLGLPIPPAIAFEDANLSPMGRSFYAENKRVANERIKSELGIALKYPDYTAGLDALVRLEEGL